MKGLKNMKGSKKVLINMKDSIKGFYKHVREHKKGLKNMKGSIMKER